MARWPGRSVPRRALRRLAVVVAVVVVLALVAVLGLRWWQARTTSDLEEAIARAPASERYSWTDWAGVRREVGGDVSPDASGAELEGFLDAAYDADLSSMSTVADSGEVLADTLGLSPAGLEWEMLSQAEDGTLLVLRVAEGVDLDRVETLLDAAGYRPPDEHGIRDGSAALDRHEIPSELTMVAVDRDDRLVVGSDSVGYLRGALDDPSGPTDDVAATADAVGDPLAAGVYSGSWTCGRLGMTSASADDQAQAEELVDEAGDVDPVLSLAIARGPEPERPDDVRVAMAFADHDQAVANADSRSRLAAGPAVGQGGDFADRFELGEVRADDRLVTMALSPTPGAAILSDLAAGPLLFATC